MIGTSAYGWILGLVLAALALGIGDFERGNRLFRAGDYEAAVAAYRDALEDGEDSPVLRYNLGTALLHVGEYEQAERHFDAALSTVEPELRQRTLYNLGNRFLEDAREADDPRQRRPLLDAAVEAYKRTLRIAPDDADAKWNLELALQEREQTPEMPSGGGNRQQRQQQSGQPQAGGGAPQSSPPANSQPQRSRGQTGGQPMTPEQAAQILSAAEQNERELMRRRLQSGRREARVLRDW